MSTNTDSFTTLEVRPWDQPQLLNSKDIKLAGTTPHFPVGLTSLDIDSSRNLRVKAYIDCIDKDSAKVHIDSWGDTILYSASCEWLEVPANDRDFQSGSFSTTDDHPWDKPQATTSCTITFAKPYAATPEVIVWLSSFDIDREHNWRIKTYVSDVTTKGFTIHIDTWGDTTLYSGSASWIAHPCNRANIVSGSYSTMDVRPWDKPQLVNEGGAKFGGGFQCVPRVWVGLNQLDVGNGANLRLRATTRDITAEGLKWNLDAWADTVLFSASASFLAIQDF